ncbi:hypothetical protein KA005_14455 [bacterium]|nr:hypothetical protein [bacterium]
MNQKLIDLLSSLEKKSKLNTFLKLFFAYVTLCGLIMFPEFIMEESIQMTTFGTWPAKDARNWSLVLKGCDTINKINLSLKILNYSVGWVQPLAFFSYRSFTHGTDYYVKSLKTLAFAKSPETFDGRKIEFTFTPQKIVREKGKVILVNRRIRVIVREMPKDKSIKIKGIVRVEGNLVIVEDEGMENKNIEDTNEHNRN